MEPNYINTEDPGTQEPELPPHPFAARLRDARGEQPIEEVARRAHVAPCTVRNLERGRGRISSFLKVTFALGVHPAQILWRPIAS